MHKHRQLAASVGFALLLTTVASTTYAQGMNQQSQQGTGLCRWFPNLPWCNPSGPGGGGGGGGGTPPPVTATPELDSLLLFGTGITGMGAYALTRFRARRRS